jgi:hypothetical protein
MSVADCEISRSIALRMLREFSTRLASSWETATPAGQAVPPRVLRDILNDGSYRDDELTASYYGGILASSRSGIPRDDRGAAFTALLARLTTYQLRAHYILYRTINALYSTTNRNLQSSDGRTACCTFVPMQDYMTAMKPEPGEPLSVFAAHVLFGLQREALIGQEFGFGSHEELKKRFPDADSGGLLFEPFALGIELFLWASGNSSLEINAISSEMIKLPELGIPACSNAKPRS